MILLCCETRKLLIVALSPRPLIWSVLMINHDFSAFYDQFYYRISYTECSRACSLDTGLAKFHLDRSKAACELNEKVHTASTLCLYGALTLKNLMDCEGASGRGVW